MGELLRGVGEIGLGDFLGGGNAAEDGITEGDAIAPVAGEMEVRAFVFDRGDLRADGGVTEFVLGDGFFVRDETGEDRLAGDAEEFAEIMEGEADLDGFAAEGKGGGAKPAKVAGEQDVVFGSALGKEGGGKDGTEDVELFDGGDETTKTIEGMADLSAVEAEGEGGDGGVVHAGEELQRGGLGSDEEDFGEFEGRGAEQHGVMLLLRNAGRGAEGEAPTI